MDEQSTASPEARKDVMVVHPYIVSPLRLAVLTLATFGLYEIYWAYRHWRSLKEYKNLNVWPWVRGIFGTIFAYFLFKEFQKMAPNIYTNKYASPVVLALSYFSIHMLIRLDDPYWLVTFLAILPLIKAQEIITLIWRKTYPEAKESTFRTRDYFIIAIGALLFTFLIWDMFFAPQI